MAAAGGDAVSVGPGSRPDWRTDRPAPPTVCRQQAVVEQTRMPHPGHQLRIVAAATVLRPWP